MNLGEAIGIYIAVGIFIILVFCIVTIFFHYQISKEYEQLMRTQQGNENSQEKQKIIDEQIQQLIKKSVTKFFSNKPVNNGTNKKVQLSDLRTPLDSNNNSNIYKVPNPKDRIYYQYHPVLPNAQNNKQIQTPNSRSNKIGIVSFKEQQITLSNLKKKSLMIKNFQESDITNHQFVRKIVKYHKELQIVENCVKFVTKINSVLIVEKTKIKRRVIKKDDLDFENLLEVYGFEKKMYSCYKFTVFLSIPKMKMRQDYLVANIKSTQSKQQISSHQYQNLKQKLYKENPN